MLVLATLRSLSQRSYQSQKTGLDVVVHQAVLEVDKPLQLITVDLQNEHIKHLERYRALVGKKVFVPMTISKREFKGQTFIDTKTSDDGMPLLAPTLANQQAAA